MRIAFVYPNSQKKDNQGPGYVMSAVLAAGHKLDFFDEMYQPFTDGMVREVADQYDVVLMSALTLYFPTAVEFATRIKARRADITILLGGLHATVAPREVLQHKCFDYICVGEGEEFAVEFLRGLELGGVEHLQNIGYRAAGDIVINPSRPCTDLATLPRYRRELFNSESIVQSSPRPGFCYVYGSRGCPYRCSYCANQCYLDLYGKSYLRVRSIDSVIQELLWIKAHYPVRFFYFGDEMLMHHKEHCNELFARLRVDVRLPYGCMARVEQIDADMVDVLASTGCEYVAMGVECGDAEFRRKFLKRYMTNEQIVTAFRLLKAAPQISRTAFCIQGWPVSYDQRLTESTHTLLDIIQPDNYQFNTFFPFPGTAIYDYCVKNDLIDWTKYTQPRDMSGESVLKLPIRSDHESNDNRQ